jgi:magnesium transporter
VLNLEHVKVIISANDVLVPNDQPESAAFAAALSARLAGLDASSEASSHGGSEHGSNASSHASLLPHGGKAARTELLHSKLRQRLAATSSTLQRLLESDERAPAARGSALLMNCVSLGHGPHARPWLRCGLEGVVTTVMLDKHGVAARCAVPLRDLRSLDGAGGVGIGVGGGGGEGAALLCRARAMVVNLLHIKLLLTHCEALLPPHAVEGARPFVAELSRRLAAKAAAGPRVDDPLPFEFLVLDAALESAASQLDESTAALESETPAALEALSASRVDATSLQRVRKVKGLIARCAGRAAAVRGEVLRFLDDDSDMRGMYLTRKWEERRAKADAGGGASGRASGVASPRMPGGAALWSTAATPGGARRRGGEATAAGHGLRHLHGLGRTRSGVATPSGGDGHGTPRHSLSRHSERLARAAAGGPDRDSECSSGSDSEHGPSGAAVPSALALALERLAEDADVQAAEVGGGGGAAVEGDAEIAALTHALLLLRRTSWRRTLRSSTAHARGWARWRRWWRRQRS